MSRQLWIPFIVGFLANPLFWLALHHLLSRQFITMKSLKDYKKLRAILLLLAFSIALSAWWFPQKWQACQKMYGNRPAQVFCLLDK